MWLFWAHYLAYGLWLGNRMLGSDLYEAADGFYAITDYELQQLYNPMVMSDQG